MTESYTIKVNEDEMMLILTALGQKAEQMDHMPAKAKAYQDLHDRLENIFEERV